MASLAFCSWFPSSRLCLFVFCAESSTISSGIAAFPITKLLVTPDSLVYACTWDWCYSLSVASSEVGVSFCLPVDRLCCFMVSLRLLSTLPVLRSVPHWMASVDLRKLPFDMLWVIRLAWGLTCTSTTFGNWLVLIAPRFIRLNLLFALFCARMLALLGTDGFWTRIVCFWGEVLYSLVYC